MIRLHRLLFGFMCCGIAATAVTSCSPETENVFGEQAAMRLQQAVANYSNTLEAAPQGWAMDFYPGDLTDGGIAYTAVFKNGRVTLSCELPIDYSKLISKSEYVYTAAQEVTSSYKVKSENSIVLSFDTFNALIHYWSQPYGLKADGFASDYEFTFVSGNDSQLVLRGKKHDKLLTLTRLTESPATYLSQVIATRAKLGDIPRKRAMVNGQLMNIEFTNNHLRFTDNEKKHDVPFTFTANGIRFYEPVTLNGISCESMTYNAESNELASADGRVVMLAPTSTERFVATTRQWYFGYDKTAGASDMCDDLKTIGNDIVRNFKNSAWGYEVLNDIYIGLNLQSAAVDEHRLVIGWHSRDNYGMGSSNYFCYGIEMDTSGDNLQYVVINPTEAGVGFDSKTYCQPFVDFITGGSPYVLTFDDNDNPAEAHLTSLADESKWFKLKLKK